VARSAFWVASALREERRQERERRALLVGPPPRALLEGLQQQAERPEEAWAWALSEPVAWLPQQRAAGVVEPAPDRARGATRARRSQTTPVRFPSN